MSFRFSLPLLLSVTSGCIATLGIIFSYLWFFAPLGLALFFYTIWFRTNTLKEVILYGYIFGLLTGGGGIVWIWNAIPLTAFAVTDPLTGALTILFPWLYIVFGFGSAIALIAIPLWYIRHHILSPLLGGLCWVIGEELRMWMFSLFTFAPQSLLGAHFSITSIGYTLSENTYLAQLANPHGIAMLNFVVAYIAGTLAILPFIRTSSYNRPRGIIAYIILLAIISTPFLFPYKEPIYSDNLRFAIISSTVQHEEKDTVTSTLFEEASTDTEVDIIVLPEGQHLSTLFPRQESSDILHNLFKGREALIIHSQYIERSATHEGSLQLSYESTTRGILATQNKVFLMPFGEYIPSVTWIFYYIFPNQHIKETIEVAERAVTRGPTPHPFLYKGQNIGSLLCSELLSPHLYTNLVENDGADILVTLSSYSWFHGSEILHKKIEQVAKIQAITSRRYLVSAENEGASFVVNPKGSIIAQSPRNTDDVLFVTIPVK